MDFPRKPLLETKSTPAYAIYIRCATSPGKKSTFSATYLYFVYSDLNRINIFMHAALKMFLQWTNVGSILFLFFKQ